MKLIKLLIAKYEAALVRSSARAIRHNDELIALARITIAILPDDHEGLIIKNMSRELLKRIDA